MRNARLALVGLVALASGACDKTPKEPEPRPLAAPAASAAPAPITALPERLSRPAPERLVAMGDLHGDFGAVQRAFRLAGATNESDAWIGGKLVVVQTGDTIDRGDDDKKILDFLDRLQGEAKAAGGELILLLGNHELMNVQQDFRYVTPGGFTAFGSAGPVRASTVPNEQQARAAAFLPGGSYALKLAASHQLFVRVGRSVFIHGGILPNKLSGLVAADAHTKTWLEGHGQPDPNVTGGEDGLVWLRAYSDRPKDADCKQLATVLASLEADRLVMGHTVQKDGINAACDGKAWRIDVGMSHFYGGPIQVLEVKGAQVTPLAL